MAEYGRTTQPTQQKIKAKKAVENGINIDQKIISVVALSLGIACGSYAFASPYLALNATRSALLDGDKKRMEKLIDFDELRQAMKEQIKGAMTVKMTRELSGNPFAGLGMMMIGPMVDGMVDTMVTPSSLKAMINEGRVKPDKNNNIQSTNSDSNYPNNQSVGYTGINSFELKTWNPDAKEQTVSFLMQCQGLGGWIINDIEFSSEVFDN